MRYPHDAMYNAVLLLIACDFQNQSIIDGDSDNHEITLQI